jgi:hypothetical protein
MFREQVTQQVSALHCGGGHSIDKREVERHENYKIEF